MFQVAYIKGERVKSLMDVDEGTFIRKRKRASPGGARKKGPKVKRKPSPLAKFRAQTLLRKKELLKIIKETNRELRAITKDLGVLKKPRKIAE